MVSGSATAAGRRARRRTSGEAAVRWSRPWLTACAGIVASLAAPALVLGSPWHWLALVGALLLFCVPAGAAVMCWVDTGEGFAQAGLTLVVSLAVSALASAAMIWAAAWHPRALLGLAAVGMVSCVARLAGRASR
jgi:hypothetical protein